MLIKQYNPRYRPLINQRKYISPMQMEKNKFYLLKEYVYSDGEQKKYNDLVAPILYTLWVSKPKDIVHCVKVTDVRPMLVQKFFGKLFNSETQELELKKRPNIIYETVVKKVPIVLNKGYRTYKLSGINRVMYLDMDIEPLVPKNKLVDKVEPKAPIEPKPKISPKEKVQPTPKIKPKSKIKPKESLADKIEKEKNKILSKVKKELAKQKKENIKKEKKLLKTEKPKKENIKSKSKTDAWKLKLNATIKSQAAYNKLKKSIESKRKLK
jgi:hypothetical protein